MSLHQAVVAARSVASALALTVDEVVVLQASNTSTLRLLPCDVVARARPVDHQIAQFEIGIAQQLAGTAASVAALDPRVEPRVYERGGFAITLWTHYQQEAEHELPPAAYAEALQRLHAGMRTIDVPAPHVTDRVAPGAGASDDPPETFGIDGYADCLGSFLDALGLGPAHIVGLSFGGALALAFQRRHGALTTSLVLASAYAGWRGSLGREAGEARLAQAIGLSRRSPQGLVDTLLPTMFALPVASDQLAAHRAAMLGFHPVGFRAMAIAAAEDVCDVLSGIDVPTLLVYGDHDERAPMHVAEDLHAAISSSRLVVLEGAGHVCNVDLPERFNEVVREFLSVHDPTG